MDEPGILQEPYSGSGLNLIKDVLILYVIQLHQEPRQPSRAIHLPRDGWPVHVSWANVPFAYVVRDVYEVERGVQVVLPTTLLVYEERKHLVKVEEVWLCVRDGMHVVTDVVSPNAIHSVGLS